MNPTAQIQALQFPVVDIMKILMSMVSERIYRNIECDTLNVSCALSIVTGFPELVFGSHAAAIAAFTYYIVIFFKTYLLIHLGLVRQREAEQQWSARHSGAGNDRYPSLDHLFE